MNFHFTVSITTTTFGHGSQLRGTFAGRTMFPFPLLSPFVFVCFAAASAASFAASSQLNHSYVRDTAAADTAEAQLPISAALGSGFYYHTSVLHFALYDSRGCSREAQRIEQRQFTLFFFFVYLLLLKVVVVVVHTSLSAAYLHSLVLVLCIFATLWRGR